jgi:hypothetical protein
MERTASPTGDGAQRSPEGSHDAEPRRGADASGVAAGRRFAGRLIRRLRHFRGPGDVVDFVRLGAFVTTAPVALAHLGLRPLLTHQLRSARGVAPVRDAAADEALARADRLARYADFWLRRLRAPNPCLRRSLALFGRLRRAGLPVTFCIGIRTDAPIAPGQEVAGHAWLELDGRAILEREPDITVFTVTFRYPDEPRSS